MTTNTYFGTQLSAVQIVRIEKKQGTQKLIASKFLKIQNPQSIPGIDTPATMSKMASLSNSRLQNRKERPNQFINNGEMAEKDKRPVSKGHLSNY